MFQIFTPPPPPPAPPGPLHGYEALYYNIDLF